MAAIRLLYLNHHRVAGAVLDCAAYAEQLPLLIQWTAWQRQYCNEKM
jgi:hypothetical protein